MSTYFLLAGTGYLIGNLLVNTPRETLWSILFILLAAGIAGLRMIGPSFMIRIVLVTLALAGGYGSSLKTITHIDELPQEVVFNHTVLVVKAEPDRGWYRPFQVRPLDRSIGGDILVRASRTLAIVPGESIHLECLLKRPENFDDRFDYARFLATRNIVYICDTAVVHEGISQVSVWRTKLFLWRSSVRHEIKKILPEPASGLLQGLLLGGDHTLSRSLGDDFRRAGISHVVAVSGYNMTLVASAFLVLALLVGFWRKTAVVIALLGIGLFLCLVDISAASLRAALMTGIVTAAYFLGRPNQMLHALVLVGVGMTLFNPLMVRYDVGFQLSLMATLALAVAVPWVEMFLHRLKRWQSFIALPLSTVVIGIFVDPIIAFHFGTISLMSPIANTLVLPLIPAAMFFGITLIGVGSLASFLVPLLLFPTWLLLMMITEVAKFIARFSWAAIEGVYPNEYFLWCWALVLAVGVWYSRKSFFAYVLRLDRSHSSH